MEKLKLFPKCENSHHLYPIQNYFLGICFPRLSIRNSIVIPNSIDEYSSLSTYHDSAKFNSIEVGGEK